MTVVTESTDPMVNKAPHYNNHPKGFECIDVIEDAPTPLLFTAMKYLWRVCWGAKGGPEKDIQDLEKAIYYTQREVNNRKRALAKSQIIQTVPQPVPAAILSKNPGRDQPGHVHEDCCK